MGEHANNYEQIAAKDKLTELQLRMRQLLDQIDQITKEQAYQRVSSVLFTTKVDHNISWQSVSTVLLNSFSTFI